MVDNDVVLPKDVLVNMLDGVKDVCLGFYAHRDSDNIYRGRTSVCKLFDDNGNEHFNYPLDSEYTAKELAYAKEHGDYKIRIHGGGMGCAMIKTDTPEDYARFLAPLDNLMWDRQMLQKLFDFEYRWEVYTPAPKRKYGYYVLPVLYNGNFVARFEPEYASKTGKFIVKNWWWEDRVEPDRKMREAIEKEMERFASFLQVENSADNVKKLL